jgi:multiple sugar transport system substrate-binding protein
MSRRALLRAISASAAVTALAGCQALPSLPGAARSGPLKVTYWKPSHGPDSEIYKELIAEFEGKNPNTKVEHNSLSWSGLDEMLTTAYAGDTPPDVVYMPDEWWPKYASQGVLADIGGIAAPFKDQFHEQFWKMSYYQGKQYGIPYLATIHALFWNKKLFAQKGIQGPPQTWDQFAEAAKKLTDEKEGTFGFGLSPNGHTQYVPMLATGGAEMLTSDLRKAAFNTPDGAKVVEFYHERIGARDKSIIPIGYTGDQINDLTWKGKVGMWWSGDNGVPVLRKQAPELEFGIAPLPKGPAKQAVWMNYGFILMAEKSKVKDAAGKWMEFLVSKRPQEAYVGAVTMFSLRKDAAQYKGDPFYNVFLEASPLGVGTTMSVNWREVTKTLGTELEAVTLGKKPAQQALADAEKTINAFLDGR